MMITIDPGEHNGISIWDGPVLKELRCLRFKETVETIESMLCEPHQNRVTLVYEVFALFPWKSSKQYFSTFWKEHKKVLDDWLDRQGFDW